MLEGIKDLFCWLCHGYNRRQWDVITEAKKERDKAVSAQRAYLKANPDFWKDKKKMQKAWDLLRAREQATDKYAEATGYTDRFPKSKLVRDTQIIIDDYVKNME